MAAYGAAKVFVADAPELAVYSCEGYTAALDAAVAAFNPGILLVSATVMGKDVGPRLAARRKAGVLSDVMSLDVAGGRLVATRPVYSGKASATVTPAEGRPLQIAMPRPNVFPAAKADAPGAGEVVPVSVAGVKVRAMVVKVETAGAGEVDVAEADKIVSGGRGIKGPENFGSRPSSALPTSSGRRSAPRAPRWTRLDRPLAPGRPDRQGRLPDALHRLRHLAAPSSTSPE